MKQLTIILAAIILFSFKGEEKRYGVSLTFASWNKHINKLEVIKQIAEESNLPHQQVTFITKSIDSLELEVVPQLRDQLKDSTIKKK